MTSHTESSPSERTPTIHTKSQTKSKTDQAGGAKLHSLFKYISFHYHKL
jgi:hypothetical protein